MSKVFKRDMLLWKQKKLIGLQFRDALSKKILLPLKYYQNLLNFIYLKRCLSENEIYESIKQKKKEKIAGVKSKKENEEENSESDSDSEKTFEEFFSSSDESSEEILKDSEEEVD